MEGQMYRSPLRKLLRFFERSRDGWKRKCRDGKAAIKRLGNRTRKLEASRNRWKERAKQMQEEVRRLRAVESQASKNALA